MNEGAAHTNQGTPPQKLSACGAVASKLSIKGQYAAGRDVHVQLNGEEAGPFLPVNTNAFYNTDYYTPVFTETANHILLTEQLLVLGGSNAFDKYTFCRWLAGKVSMQPEHKMPVLTWVGPGKHGTLFQCVQGLESSSVIIFDQLAPQALCSQFVKLQQLAQKRGHYLIISTGLPESFWLLPNGVAAQCWFAVPQSNNYSHETLYSALQHQIQKIHTEAPAIGRFNMQTWLDHMPVKQLVQLLHTPDQIAMLMARLKATTQVPEPEAIIKLAYSIANEDVVWVQGFYQSLETHQQLMLLVALITDGAFDEQYFELLRVLNKQAWEERFEVLSVADYCDLTFLQPLFSFDKTDQINAVVRIRYPQQKHLLLSMAWQGLKRHILKAMPVIGHLMAYMLAENGAAALFDTRAKRTMLNRSFSHFMAEMARLCQPAAEEVLVFWALHPKEEVRKVAAQSLSYLREWHEEALFLKVLQKWLSPNFCQQVVAGTQQQWPHLSPPCQPEDIPHFIQQVALLTLAYATAYDHPNHLHKSIIGPMRALASSKDSLVIRRLNSVLGQLVQVHPWQFHHVLPQAFMHQHDFRETIARGLVSAAKEHPGVIMEIIDKWKKQYDDKAADANLKNHLTETLVLTIKYFMCSTARKNLDTTWAFELLQSFLPNTQCPKMRFKVIQTMVALYTHNLEKSTTLVKACFNLLQPAEQLYVLSVLAEGYSRAHVNNKKGRAARQNAIEPLTPPVQNQALPPASTQTTALPLAQLMFTLLQSQQQERAFGALFWFIETSRYWNQLRKHGRTYLPDACQPFQNYNTGMAAPGVDKPGAIKNKVVKWAANSMGVAPAVVQTLIDFQNATGRYDFNDFKCLSARWLNKSTLATHALPTHIAQSKTVVAVDMALPASWWPGRRQSNHFLSKPLANSLSVVLILVALGALFFKWPLTLLN